MSTLALYSKIELLPDTLKKQVLDYIEFLLSRDASQGSKHLVKSSDAEYKAVEETHGKPPSNKKPLKAGFLKDSFVMTDDFEAPLEDFKEYMQ